MWYTVSMTTTTTTRVVPGAEVSIAGVRGRFTVRSIADNGDVTCFGGRPGYGSMRTFKADRIKTVHRIKTINVDRPPASRRAIPAPVLIDKGRVPAPRRRR